MNPFNISDPVILKDTGKQLMTINRIDGDNCICVWQNGAVPYEKTYHWKLLELFDDVPRSGVWGNFDDEDEKAE